LYIPLMKPTSCRHLCTLITLRGTSPNQCGLVPPASSSIQDGWQLQVALWNKHVNAFQEIVTLWQVRSNEAHFTSHLHLFFIYPRKSYLLLLPPHVLPKPYTFLPKHLVIPTVQECMLQTLWTSVFTMMHLVTSQKIQICLHSDIHELQLIHD
jgi:hypothetical protein